MRHQHKFYSLFLAVALLHLVPAFTADAAQLTLIPSRDLGTLRIGDSATVDVVLSGIDGGATLDSLFAAITFDDSLLSAGPPVAGGIVPSPLADPADFLASADAGLVDVAFSTFSTEASRHLSGDGVFVSFSIMALAEGSGQVALDFVGASLFNIADPGSPTDLSVSLGSPLTFAVVPEPSAGWLLAGGVSALLGRVVARRRRVD